MAVPTYRQVIYNIKLNLSQRLNFSDLWDLT